jgi:hypothetical protein
LRFDAFTNGGSDTLASIAAASERAVNWYPQPIEGQPEKNQFCLIRTPGLKRWATAPQYPIRGLWPGAGRLFAAAGSNLYEGLANADGSFSSWVDHGNIGNDGKPVQMFPNGNQLLVISGGYAYCDNGSGVVRCQFSVQLTDLEIDNATGRLTAATGGPFDATDVGKTVQITSGAGFTVQSNVITAVDADGMATGTSSWGTAGSSGGLGIEWLGTYVPAAQGTFLDSYFFAVAANSKQVYFSAPNDGTQWNPTDYFSNSAYPDNIAALIADHSQIYTFGQLEATEVFHDQGALNPLVPFAPDPNALIHYGCGASWAACRFGEGLVWIGGDVRRGERCAFYTVGFRPRKISTAAVEWAWHGYPTVADAIAYTEIGNGHQFWVIHFPSGDATWAYDLTTGMWAERGWWGGAFDANGFPVFHRQRQCYHAVVSFGTNGDQHYVGDWQNGNVYVQSAAYLDDDGTAIYRLRRAPHMTAENKFRFYSRWEIDCDTTQTQRVYWNRCGKGRDRVWQVVSWQTASTGVSLSLSWSDSRAQSWFTRGTQALAPGVDVTLANAYLDVIQGGS